MPIQPTVPVRDTFSSTKQNPIASTLPAPFVRRGTEAVPTKSVAADVKDGGPFEKWKNQVFEACEKKGLKPGEHMSLTVAGKEMVLRRTQTGDAYVLQTPDDRINAPFNGLHLNSKLDVSYNMEPVNVKSDVPINMEGFNAFSAFGNAFGIPRGGHGY